MWEHAIFNIDSLGDRQWIDYGALNVYLYYRWGKVANRPVRYMLTQLLRVWEDLAPLAYNQAIDSVAGPNFRYNYGLPQVGVLPHEILVFAIHERSHFFIVVMDHANRKVWVVGRTVLEQRSDRWEEWQGPAIYKHLCRLHEWDAGDTSTVRPHSVVIEQDGINCGPSAIRVALCLFEHGLQFTAARKLRCPPRLCAHLARIMILVELCKIFALCKANFDALRLQRPREWLLVSDHSLAEEEYRITEDTLTSLAALTLAQLPQHPVFLSLREAVLSCVRCSHAGTVYQEWQRLLQNSDTEGPELDRGEPAAPCPQEEGGERAESVLGDTLTDEEGAPFEVYEPPARKTRKKVKIPMNRELTNPKRFPRPIEPQPLPSHLRPRFVKHDEKFDEYYSGPTREEGFTDNPNLGDAHALYTFDPVTKTIFPSSWTRFADQGMRLLAGFAHMYYQGGPWNIVAHVLPAARLSYVLSDYFASLHRANSQHEYMKARRGVVPQDDLEGFAATIFGPPDDVRFMGLQNMLAGRGLPGCSANVNRFIRGRTETGKFICLDIERDGVALQPEQVDVHMDLDSIIWVTRELKVKWNIGVATTPTVGKVPPIRKNNHVYVRVLQPPTHDERLSGIRDYVEVPTSLSIIPHTIFAQVVEGGSPVNIMICFPRMLHKKYATDKWEALIPYEIQRLFWNEVLLPALRASLQAHHTQYVAASVENIQLKAGSKEQKQGGLFRAKTLSVSPSVLEDMLERMNTAVRRDPNLSLYGSFFFVLDAKNYKLQTSVPISALSNQDTPWDRLKQTLPQLDFDYMADRRYGELTVDLAITFNPRAPDVPLVGLWRLDVLEASYGAGGYTRGNLHHIASLSRYGAMQATMGAERSRHGHVLYRSSYNLQYEVIRPSNNQPYFAEDGDAYEGHVIYHQECHRRVTAYAGDCRRQSFGIRDEIRMGGQALKEYLEGWQDTVSS